MNRILLIGKNREIKHLLMKELNIRIEKNYLVVPEAHEFDKALADDYFTWLNILLDMDTIYPKQYLVFCNGAGDGPAYIEKVVKYMHEVISENPDNKYCLRAFIIREPRKTQMKNLAGEIIDYIDNQVSPLSASSADNAMHIFELVL